MDEQTDDGQSDPYVPLCFAGDTKTSLKRIHAYNKPYNRSSITEIAIDITTLMGNQF